MAVYQQNTNQHLTFRLGKDEFGIEILGVREILEYREPTRVPRTSRFIAGVINIRGNVVPVINLSRLFLGRETEITKRTCILILEIYGDKDDIIAGVLVDSVNEVISINKENIDPPPNFGSRLRADFIKGMGRLEDRIVILLNPSSMLNFNEIVELTKSIDSSSSIKESITDSILAQNQDETQSDQRGAQDSR